MFLGLDLGTSGLRAVLMHPDGSVVGAAEASYPISHPFEGWSEQSPVDWIVAVRTCMDQLRSAHADALSKLAGIGVSGQMHGAVCLDSDGAVLRPAILWNDTRSHLEAAALDATPGFRDITGTIVFPGFTAPKLCWMQKNEPDLFAKIAKVLLPAGFLNLFLTGRYVADMSDSAGTAWLDVGARDWSEPLLRQSGMRRDQMPDLVEGSEIAGSLRPELAHEWGVSPDVVVVGGAGDNAAAACGAGLLQEGQGFVSLGTSGVLTAAKNSFAPAPQTAVHTFCHAVPQSWYQMGVILAATDSLNWLARNLGSTASTLTQQLGPNLRAPGKVRFLPYLSGERTPHNDSLIRGSLIGLDISSGHEDLTQAVLEGVSFALCDSLHALRTTGTDLKRVLALGGGAQSDYWVELLATVFDIPIDVPTAGEFGAALGAARLAQCGATGANPVDVMTPPAIARTVLPNRDLVEVYRNGWERYRASYAAIRAIQ